MIQDSLCIQVRRDVGRLHCELHSHAREGSTETALFMLPAPRVSLAKPLSMTQASVSETLLAATREIMVTQVGHCICCSTQGEAKEHAARHLAI